MASKRLLAIMDDKEKAAMRKDKAMDKKKGIKEGSAKDKKIDAKVMAKAMPKTYKGKSTKLGQGGRAAKLNDKLAAKGMSKKERGGIIGMIARKKGAAPGGKNYH